MQMRSFIIRIFMTHELDRTRDLLFFCDHFDVIILWFCNHFYEKCYEKCTWAIRNHFGQFSSLFISFVQWKMSLSIQVMEGTRIISFAQINELLNGFLDLWSDDPPVRPKMYNSPFWLRRRQSRHHTRNRYARSGREDELIYMSSALSKAHYDLNGTATVKPSN